MKLFQSTLKSRVLVVREGGLSDTVSWKHYSAH